MATSLFGHDRARNAVQKPFSNPLNSGNQKEIEEQIRLENEALLDSLSNSVLRMKSVAGGLGREVNEQNSLLNSLGGAFTAAKSGVKTSVEHLTNVVNRYGWKQTCYLSVVLLFILYIFFKVVF